MLGTKNSLQRRLLISLLFEHIPNVLIVGGASLLFQDNKTVDAIKVYATAHSILHLSHVFFTTPLIKFMATHPLAGRSIGGSLFVGTAVASAYITNYFGHTFTPMQTLQMELIKMMMGLTLRVLDRKIATAFHLDARRVRQLRSQTS